MLFRCQRFQASRKSSHLSSDQPGAKWMALASIGLGYLLSSGLRWANHMLICPQLPRALPLRKGPTTPVKVSSPLSFLSSTVQYRLAYRLPHGIVPIRITFLMVAPCCSLLLEHYKHSMTNAKVKRRLAECGTLRPRQPAGAANDRSQCPCGSRQGTGPNRRPCPDCR